MTTTATTGGAKGWGSELPYRSLVELGAIIAPPVPAFYAQPQNLEEMIDHTLGRVLDLFGLEAGYVKRWGETAERRRPAS